MQLKNFFSPIINTFSRNSLTSKNPKIRIKAILEELEPGNPELANIAINDSDIDVKSCAIHRLTSLDTIQDVIMKSRDEKSKAILYLQLSKLLCGEIFPIPDLQEREKVVKGHLPNKNIEYIALNAKEPELRIISILKLNRDALLGDIAINDAISQVKITAAQQIGKKSTLERVCKTSRSKDKKVYKICKDKLQLIIDDEQRPTRISLEIIDLCDKLEKTYKRNLLLQEESAINQLKEKWHEYHNFTNEQTQLRYQTIISKIDSAIGKLKQQQQNEQQIRENLQQIIHNLSIESEELLDAKENNKLELIQSKLKTIELYKNNWAEQVQKITSKKHADIIKQYNSILILIEQAEEIEENLPAIDLLNQYIAQADQLLSHSHYVSEKFLNSLESNFSIEYQKAIQISTQSSILVKEYQTNFNKKITQLQQRIETQQEEYKKLIQTSDRLIKEIDQKLDEGLTDEASHLKKKYHFLIDKTQIISSKDKEIMLEKISSSDKKLNQLSSWKNWANNQERENLCQQAELLLKKIQQSDDIAQAYNDYGDQIKILRSAWKKLKGRSADELWEKFNSSCNQCFEIFKPYFEQQSKQRDANLQLKETICLQLEDYIQYMNWPTTIEKATIDTSIDWINVNKIVRKARNEWQNIGPIEKQYQHKVTKKFNNLVAIINQELKQTWSENLNKYQLLIDQVYDLHKDIDKDLNKAINEAKSLQSLWKKIGPVQPLQRKTLWKNFRKGCDIIFNKREEIKLEENQANESLLMEKTGLCENLQALNQQTLSIEDLNEAYTQIESTWSNINALHPTKKRAVDKQFEEAQKYFFKKIKLLKIELDELKKQQQIELFKQKSSICSDLENNKHDSNTDIIEKWQGLGKLKTALQDKQMEARFKQATQIADQSISGKALEQLIEQTYKEKEQLCLSLEVLTGQQSPDDEAQKRLEFQIQQMNSHVKTASNNPSVDEIVSQWYLTPDFEQHSTLKNRFENIAVLKNS